MKNFEDFRIWFEKELSAAKISLDSKCIELLYQTFFSKIEPVQKPEIIALGGGPGSGKTTFRKKHLNTESDTHYIHDLDETLILLPGYQEQLSKEGAISAFKSWWPIAQKITNIMMMYATKNKFNIIYDRTCGTEESYLALKAAIGEGYSIKFFGFYVVEEIALKRVSERTKAEGRAVTSEIVSEYLRRFSTLWPLYLKIMNNVILFENNDAEYKEIFKKSNNRSQVINYTAYRSFLSAAYNPQLAESKFPNIPAILDEKGVTTQENVALETMTKIMTSGKLDADPLFGQAKNQEVSTNSQENETNDNSSSSYIGSLD